ncbi:hypothetical protein AAXE64_27580 [Priestia megaterium]
MPYSNYRGPGVDVSIERREVEQKSPETQFYPVFIGTGVTSRNRSIQKKNIRANTEKFPQVTLTFDLIGDMNFDLFDVTKFQIGQVVVTRASAPQGESATVALEPNTDFTVVKNVTFNANDSTVSVVLNITSSKVVANDAVYELNITASNADKDFDLRLMGTENRFYSKDIFGHPVLKEDDNEFYNDIAIAAEIAFRMQVPRFYYLEVPRDYGKEPSLADFKAAVEKVYYFEDAYRIVPLTSKPEIANILNNFVSGVSNPKDRRETVSFVSYDTTKIENLFSIDELVTKVGGYSESLNSKRVCNVFCGDSVELRMEDQLYVLPAFYMSVAVACLDAVIGKVDPLSLREITVFEKINAPRFRPVQWDMLAKRGVFIVVKDNDRVNAKIRHQLTTAQTNIASDQEYSVVKNLDVVTKKFRDRLSVYAGQYNVDSGYLERLEGTTATVRQEVLEERLAKSITIITAWQINDTGDGRDLVTRMQMDPVYPANHLDVYLVI